LNNSRISKTAVLENEVVIGEDFEAGHGSHIGAHSHDCDKAARIGDRVTVGSFCIIEAGCEILDDVEIDNYCRVGSGVKIGEKTKIVDGVQVHNYCQIGSRCIVGGELAERTIIESDVTFMGRIAHKHRHPTDADTWDTTDEPSPTILAGSVVGLNALIIGDVQVGPSAYVGAGEILRHDLGEGCVLYKGEVSRLDDWRGLIKCRVRQDE